MGLVLTGAVACSHPGASTDGGADGGVSAAVVPGPTKTPQALQTTAPSIAISNLDAEIALREKRVASGQLDAAPELVGRYLHRAQFEGRVSDLIAADEASARLLAARPDDGKAHLTRASALSAIHAFGQALGELDVASAKGAVAVDVARARGSILLATGREDEAAAVLTVRDDSKAPELVMRAGVEARRANDAEAERLFDLARARYHDVSPFTVAWMDFEHARALELQGDRRRARPYLEEAIQVLPCYAHAVVHLAAVEAPDVALKQLTALDATSDDPDVLSGKGDALRRAGRTDEAKAMTARAAARYAEVLARLPLAYADHAASFYLGMGGDPARALQLAKQNVDNRPTDEAIELWLTAAQAAGSHDATCAAAARALARPHASQELRDRATGASKGCT